MWPRCRNATVPGFGSLRGKRLISDRSSEERYSKLNMLGKKYDNQFEILEYEGKVRLKEMHLLTT